MLNGCTCRRPDKITLQGLDTIAPDDIIAGGGLLEDIFQDIDAPQTPHVSIHSSQLANCLTPQLRMDCSTPSHDDVIGNPI